MLLIDKILIDEEITEVKFECDLNKCKGGCCTFPGELGAPLKDEEIIIMKNSLEVVSEYLSKKSKDEIKKHGFYQGRPGSHSTYCINKRDCVFVFYEDGIARCAFEKAYFEGKIAFRKPISCQLFPIRVANFGGMYLYYQKFDECLTALDKGKENNTIMYKFLKEPIVRALGEEWYNTLSDYIDEHQKNDSGQS